MLVFSGSTFVICLLMASLNSCCNPWIYMAFSGSLIQQTLPCCRVCHRQPKSKTKQQQQPLVAGGGGKGQSIPLKTRSKKPLLENIQLQTKTTKTNIYKSSSRLPWRNRTTMFSRTASTKLTGFLPPNDVTVKSRHNVINVNSRERRQHAMKGCDCATCMDLVTRDKDNLAKGSSGETSEEPDTPTRIGNRRANNSYPFLFYKPFNYEKVEMKCTSV